MWSKSAAKAFDGIKNNLITAPILHLVDFSKVFKVACDTSTREFRGVIRQEGHPITYLPKN